MNRALVHKTLKSVSLVSRPQVYRAFHSSRFRFVVKPFLLADIGEGITEVQIIQWFVQPGAKVEQFDKLCEVQSDKASVEITSRFDGVIKKLHYDADDMAIVGKPLVDIDIQGELSAEDEKLTSPSEEGSSEQQSTEEASSQEQQRQQQQQPQQEEQQSEEGASASKQSMQQTTPQDSSKKGASSADSAASSSNVGTLATPAVRRLTKEHNVDLAEIEGTGKDGRVLKEDVHNFIAARDSGASDAASTTPSPSASSKPRILEDKSVNLTPMQGQMLKTMTKSLNIPHFLYSDTMDMSAINALRRSMNTNAASSDQKLSVLPFLIKAVSLALIEYPILNARLDTTTNPDKPQLVFRGTHNIGIAVDTPQGLLVPVIKGVQDLSVGEVAAEARRLSGLAREGKLSAEDMKGGTFSVSNVGSIGGGVVAPVIVESQLAIVGVGRTKIVPAFNDDGDVVRREECTLSWSADHRVCDGATVARCAEMVKTYMEMPEAMLVKLR